MTYGKAEEQQKSKLDGFGTLALVYVFSSVCHTVNVVHSSDMMVKYKQHTLI